MAALSQVKVCTRRLSLRPLRPLCLWHQSAAAAAVCCLWRYLSVIRLRLFICLKSFPFLCPLFADNCDVDEHLQWLKMKSSALSATLLALLVILHFVAACDGEVIKGRTKGTARRVLYPCSILPLLPRGHFQEGTKRVTGVLYPCPILPLLL